MRAFLLATAALVAVGSVSVGLHGTGAEADGGVRTTTQVESTTRGVLRESAVRQVLAAQPGDVLPAEVVQLATGTVMTDTPSLSRIVARPSDHRVAVSGIGSAAVVNAPVRRGRVVVPSGPAGMRQVGWLTTSAKPSATRGTSTYFFHRDRGGGGRGQHHALFELPSVKRGQVVKVQTGRVIREFTVTRVEEHQKGRLPASLNDRTGARRIAFVTCGGGLRLVRGTWRWAKQVVVWAVPIRPTA